MRELETEEKRSRESNMSSREKQMCYWGLKFEDYVTRKGSDSHHYTCTFTTLGLWDQPLAMTNNNYYTVETSEQRTHQLGGASHFALCREVVCSSEIQNVLTI